MWEELSHYYNNNVRSGEPSLLHGFRSDSLAAASQSQGLWEVWNRGIIGMGIRLYEVKEKCPSVCKMNILSMSVNSRIFLVPCWVLYVIPSYPPPLPPLFSFCVCFGHGPRRAVIYGGWKCVVTNFMQKNLLQNPAKMWALNIERWMNWLNTGLCLQIELSKIEWEIENWYEE